MSERTYQAAGTAKNPDGITKVRFIKTEDLSVRIKLMQKKGCKDINMIVLPEPMTKMEALKHLKSIAGNSEEADLAIAHKIAELNLMSIKKAKADAKRPRSLEQIKQLSKSTTETENA